ncbi:general amino acid permease [Nadsonia fulvescens var. elongata DSM 6958]|uniref:General amino acid permease n=1 Tax=Nadsonia fulvescens var. elongata DSM 6958 TaxID=857566 RepID=A0A1E3PN71_9ASCO|nr:general amino acid permease [Nadsonia fulvescens var. elongata DSM 6958]
MSEKQFSKTPDYAVNEVEIGQVETVTVSGWQGFMDSFKRMKHVEIDTEGMTDLEKAAALTASSPLSRKLKSRHLQMIAIGGSIGTGLFVGSGGSLRTGGPAAVVIAFILIGSMLFSTVHAMGELAVTFPVSGSFCTYFTRFLDPAWGFAMGWNYAMGWLVVFPLEIIAASITLSYWDEHHKYNPAIWVTLFWALIVIINFFGVKGYGEAEFFFSIVKVCAIVGFIILGVVVACGGGPKGGYIGAKYWHDPGSFAAGFKGLCAVFVNAAFAFSGTELVGLAAAETANPRRSLPKATKQVFWRITLFYVISLTIVGCLVPYNDPRLIKKSSVDASASPFVIAIVNAGIGGLPSVMNAVILISVLSVGNSSIYAASRTLAALADQGQAPKFLAYIDCSGRPLYGIIITSAFGLLCYLVASDKRNEVFSWMLALSGLSSIFIWGSINLCHIRFRRGMKVQGRSLKELPFTSAVGVYGSWYGFTLNCLVLVANFWVAVWPIGASPDAATFFNSYLAAPIILVFYVCYKAYKRTPFILAKDMDLITGRRHLDLVLLTQELEEERAFIKSKNMAYRVYKFWC